MTTPRPTPFPATTPRTGYAPSADDNLEPAKAQALLEPVLPALLSPDYSADSDPIVRTGPLKWMDLEDGS
ncbi:hypothetical protein Tco_0526372 [Tanacetum coccineum]